MRSRKPGAQHRVTVEIAGDKHVVRSDMPPEYTRAVAAHVDAAVRALGQAKPLEPYRAAVWAALSITDELFRAREEVAALRTEIAEQTELLAMLLAPAAGEAPDDPVDFGDEQSRTDPR